MLFPEKLFAVTDPKRQISPPATIRRIILLPPGARRGETERDAVNRLTPAKVTMLMLMVMGGLIVAYIAKNLFAGSKGPAGPVTRNVPMALADIPEGTLITASHVGTGPVLESDLQRDVLLSMPSILGRITRTKLVAATPIRSTMLYAPNETPPLKVAEGLDAVTITVDGAAR